MNIAISLRPKLLEALKNSGESASRELSCVQPVTTLGNDNSSATTETEGPGRIPATEKTILSSVAL
jgi:hypothetical protein